MAEELFEIIKVLDRVVCNLEEPCACMGPQNDEPLCPCAMRDVVFYRGRWVRMVLLPLEDADEDWTEVRETFEVRDRLRYERDVYWSEKAINKRVTKMDPRRLP